MTIPKHILAELGLTAGDGAVVFRVADDDPEVVLIMSMAVADRRMQIGERTERLRRLTEPSRKIEMNDLGD